MGEKTQDPAEKSKKTQDALEFFCGILSFFAQARAVLSILIRILISEAQYKLVWTRGSKYPVPHFPDKRLEFFEIFRWDLEFFRPGTGCVIDSHKNSHL